jgi:hypothetical protein
MAPSPAALCQLSLKSANYRSKSQRTRFQSISKDFAAPLDFRGRQERPSSAWCVFRRKGPGVSVQTDHPVRAKRTGPEDGDATPIQLSEVVRAGRCSCQELLSNFAAGVVGSVGNPVGLSKAGGQAGRIAGSPAVPGEGRGRDLPGLSTGRHFPQPFVVPRDRSERQRRDPGAERRQHHHGAGGMVTRSESATGSSQWGQGAPGPSRRQNVPHPSQRWAPR